MMQPQKPLFAFRLFCPSKTFPTITFHYSARLPYIYTTVRFAPVTARKILRTNLKIMFKELLHKWVDNLPEEIAEIVHLFLSAKHAAPPVAKPASGNDPDNDGDNDVAHPSETGE